MLAAAPEVAGSAASGSVAASDTKCSVGHCGMCAMSAEGAAALQRLKSGNARFAYGVTERVIDAEHALRAALAEGQAPFAVILGCSDSRVPAELIFDQGLGDLFVIRVAGNVVAPSQIGSVEFAAAEFGVRLVVVLGHSQCGAVRATLQQLRGTGDESSRGLESIVQRIRPSVQHVLAGRSCSSWADENLMAAATHANVVNSVRDLRRGSSLIESMVQSDQMMIIGAHYALEAGTVHFFDDAALPPSGPSESGM